MSVCFFVPADGGSSNSEVKITNIEDVQDTESENNAEDSNADSLDQQLQIFWSNVTDDIKKSKADHFKTQTLPLARIKKIMKLDEEVKMISAEAPVLFAKAAEIFIHELTLRAWAHAEDNKRRTLQRNDIAMAISKSDQFDFLIDIVPRHEVKPTKTREEPARPAPPTDQYYLQLAQQHNAALQNNAQQTQQQIVLEPYTQMQSSSSTASTSAPSTSTVQQPVTMIQQMVQPNNEMQQLQLPIQLSQAQLNMIRLQMQTNPGQPIIIQAQPSQSPQIIQVASQAQQPQQVYLAQVATSQDDS